MKIETFLFDTLSSLFQKLYLNCFVFVIRAPCFLHVNRFIYGVNEVFLIINLEKGKFVDIL